MAGTHRLWIAIAVVLCETLTLGNTNTRACEDYFLSENDLTQILDSALGELRPYTKSRSVRIVPSEAQCYLKMRVDVGIPSISACTVSGCSTAVSLPEKIGIRSFALQGCEPVFRFLDLVKGDLRTMPDVFTDAKADISAHCGTGNFEITSVSAENGPNGPRMRVRLARTRSK